MKILFISMFDPFKGGSGPGNHLRYISEGLRDLGCEVHILTNGSETKDLKFNGVFIHYYNPPLGSLGRGFLFSLFSIGLTKHIIERYRIDIVTGESPSSFGYALTRLKTPFVVTVHSTSFGELASFSLMPIGKLSLKTLRDILFIQPLTALLTKIEYQFADRIIAVSDNVSREVASYYRLSLTKTFTIYNCVAPVFVSRAPKIKPNNHMLLFVGRLIWRKGVKYLIDAMPNILTDYPDTKLLIVGSGDQKPFLENLVKDYQIEGSVQFLGYVSEERLSTLYRETDIYLQPSLYEPFGIALLDAMSFGKPVIASNVGGIPEFIKTAEDGLLVLPGDSSQLALAVRDIFSNPSFKEKLGRNARKKVDEEFTCAEISQRTFDFYQNLLRNC